LISHCKGRTKIKVVREQNVPRRTFAWKKDKVTREWKKKYIKLSFMICIVPFTKYYYDDQMGGDEKCVADVTSGKLKVMEQ
jgi:hypothetical protein